MTSTRDPSAMLARDATRRRERSGLRSASWPRGRGPQRVADPDGERDLAALARFDAAFADEDRDPQWSDETEARISALFASTPETPALEDVECRRTLCRIDVRGSSRTLPTGDPFELAWWIDHEDEQATLLLVRDGAEIPLPREEPS
jgi:hypothetical protein